MLLTARVGLELDAKWIGEEARLWVSAFFGLRDSLNHLLWLVYHVACCLRQTFAGAAS